MDKLSAIHRSWLMSRVKTKNTTPEMVVRKIVHAMGFRYRLHDKRLPGTPDLVFRRKRKAIFVNGCFWHGHSACNLGRLPKSNLEYWEPKIAKNIVRDSLNLSRLKIEGWEALTVWQCEIKNIEKVSEKLHEFLK